ncbi:MAG: RNA-binding protein [Bacteroidia bacterium]
MRLRVSSIDISINKLRLEEMFEEFGEVSSIRFLKGITGESIAFIEMRREQDAYDAIEGLNGHLAGKLKLKVEISMDHVQVKNRPAVIIQDDDDEDEDDDSGETTGVEATPPPVGDDDEDAIDDDVEEFPKSKDDDDDEDDDDDDDDDDDLDDDDDDED